MATLACKMFAFYVSLFALSSCFLLFFVSFSSATKAVADTLQAVFLALIMHRCCGWCGKGIFVQGIPGVTQIDGDLWESSLLWGNRGHLWERGWGGVQGGQIEGRGGGRGAAGHRRPATNSHLKKRSRPTKVCFHPGLRKGTEKRSLYDICVHAHTHTHARTHTFTQFSESASLSSNLCKLKVWPEKAFMCNVCNKEVCGWVGCCLNWELMREAGWGRKWGLGGGSERERERERERGGDYLATVWRVGGILLSLLFSSALMGQGSPWKQLPHPSCVHT